LVCYGTLYCHARLLGLLRGCPARIAREKVSRANKGVKEKTKQGIRSAILALARFLWPGLALCFYSAWRRPNINDYFARFGFCFFAVA
jgi:hypothetical protein